MLTAHSQVKHWSFGLWGWFSVDPQKIDREQHILFEVVIADLSTILQDFFLVWNMVLKKHHCREIQNIL